MPAITLKNLSDELYGHLKDAAQTHHRSINSELIHCLETVLRPRKTEPDQMIAAARTLRARVNAKQILVKNIDVAKKQGRT